MPDPGDSRSEQGKRRTAWLAVDVIEDSGDWSRIAAVGVLVETAASALARHPRFTGHEAASACVALSTDAEVRVLNKIYRKQNKATNVLSFPASPAGAAAQMALGDVVLALETVLREAEEQGIEPGHHLQHLVVHGLLHLLGYDHMTADEADIMEGLEVEILAGLGIADPYSETPRSNLAKVAGTP